MFLRRWAPHPLFQNRGLSILSVKKQKLILHTMTGHTKPTYSLSALSLYFSSTDSIVKLSIQLEFSLVPTVPMTLRHAESGKLPLTWADVWNTPNYHNVHSPTARHRPTADCRLGLCWALAFYVHQVSATEHLMHMAHKTGNTSSVRSRHLIGWILQYFQETCRVL